MRTLGWIQDSTDINKLKNIVRIFVPNSDINLKLRNELVPNFPDFVDKESMLQELSSSPVCISFKLLIGKGAPKGFTRKNAPCSGIGQAVLPAQNGRPYQSDWATKSFVLWAIAVGFLSYNCITDKCTITQTGLNYAMSDAENETEIIKNAFLSYPPLCRILTILNNEPDKFFTKYEIGTKFGFVGEKGFTSYSLRFMREGLKLYADSKDRRVFITNTEGTSDKYVRTILSWLETLNMVDRGAVNIQITEDYIQPFHGYRLTIEGRRAINKILGQSKHSRINKIVYYEMLATSDSDASYLRKRRALTIQYFNSSAYKKISNCVLWLKKEGVDANLETIKDDLRGLENIGLNVLYKGMDSAKIIDTIEQLSIPKEDVAVNNNSDIEKLKNEIRPYLKNVDHKYLTLIDYGIGNGAKADRDYELMTAELLTTELELKGARLGDTRKPDVCVFYEEDGLIIDNKAYSNGYSLPTPQADEMIRYIEENKSRNPQINNLCWWNVFDDTVSNFHFAFVSSSFVGSYVDRLRYIYLRTSVKGAAITTINLLYIVELVKSGSLTYRQFFKEFNSNREIRLLEN